MELSHTDVEGVWQKDGIRVKPHNQWRVSTNGRVHGLTLSGLTLEDTGTIVCAAEGLRTSARLNVQGTCTGVCVYLYVGVSMGVHVYRCETLCSKCLLTVSCVFNRLTFSLND